MSVATCPVQWWNVHKGGDPGTDQAKKGADSLLPGWHPEEKATKLPKEGKLSKQRGCHQCTKGRGPKNSAATKVKGVAAPLASAWLSRQHHMVYCPYRPAKSGCEMRLCAAAEAPLVEVSVRLCHFFSHEC